MFENIQPQEVDIEFVRQRAEQIGKTNKQWNVYSAVADWHDQLEKMGLTPIILVDPVSQGTMVTSKEHLSKKFH